MAEQIPQVAVEAAEARLIGDNPPGTKAWHDTTRTEIRVTLNAALPSLTDSIRGPVEAERDHIGAEAILLSNQLEEVRTALSDLYYACPAWMRGGPDVPSASTRAYELISAPLGPTDEAGELAVENVKRAAAASKQLQRDSIRKEVLREQGETLSRVQGHLEDYADLLDLKCRPDDSADGMDSLRDALRADAASLASLSVVDEDRQEVEEADWRTHSTEKAEELRERAAAVHRVVDEPSERCGGARELEEQLRREERNRRLDKVQAREDIQNAENWAKRERSRADARYTTEAVRERMLSIQAVFGGANAQYDWLNPSAPNTQETAEERETCVEPFGAGMEAALTAAFPAAVSDVAGECERCGDTGLISVEGEAVSGQSGAIGIPESAPCPYCAPPVDEAVSAEEAAGHDFKLPDVPPITLSLEEATALVSAAHHEDHNYANFDAAIKRLGDWIDFSLALTQPSPEITGGEKCEKCGGPIDLVWWCSDEFLWEAVTGNRRPSGTREPAAGTWCVQCFDLAARDLCGWIEWSPVNLRHLVKPEIVERIAAASSTQPKDHPTPYEGEE